MAEQRRIVWVHGIGEHRAGYSSPWRKVFNPFLELSDGNYLEVLWEPVLEGRPPGSRAGGRGVRLTPEERVEERQIHDQLEARLAQQTVIEGTVQGGARSTRVDARPREWSAARRQVPRGIVDVLLNPGESIGDFARYLASRRIRLAVKECFKLQLRPLIGKKVTISVISHSWGTVVAHDALVDLASEQPNLRVGHLFTLGSPLWLVRPFLDQRGGRPANLAHWTNVHAKGDVVGSWLKPAFKVDRDYEVPSVGRDAHGSYFVKGNEAVQGDLISSRILGR